MFKGVDPLDVINRPESALPDMQRLYASAAADLDDEPDADVSIDLDDL